MQNDEERVKFAKEASKIIKEIKSPVEVDYYTFLTGVEKDLKENPLEANALKYFNYGDFSNIVYSELWQRLPLDGRSYSLNCDEENLVCNLKIYKVNLDAFGDIELTSG